MFDTLPGDKILYFGIFFSAENVAEVIQNAITEWKLPTVYGIPPLVSDNAANMTKAARILGGTHIGCLAHTLNLAAQKALKLKNVAHTFSCTYIFP